MQAAMELPKPGVLAQESPKRGQQTPYGDYQFAFPECLRIAPPLKVDGECVFILVSLSFLNTAVSRRRYISRSPLFPPCSPPPSEQPVWRCCSRAHQQAVVVVQLVDEGEEPASL